MACLRGGIFTLVAFANHHIIVIVIFAISNVHHCLQFGSPSFAAPVQLAQKSENLFKLFLQLLQTFLCTPLFSFSISDKMSCKIIRI